MYIKIKSEVLPEDLEMHIDDYVNALNSGVLTPSESEMYRMEILTELNFCKRENILSSDTISKLKDYYVWNGILNNEPVTILC